MNKPLIISIDGNIGSGKSTIIKYLQCNVEGNNKSDWPNQFQWIMENLEKMDKFFRSKVKAL